MHSDLLVRQIPRSYAANAFNVFQSASLLFELLRLSVLWDPCGDGDLEKESIPAVVQLIDKKEVFDILGKPKPLSSREDEFHRRLYARAYERLLRSVRMANRLKDSARMESLRNFRDKHIAHALRQTRLEKRRQHMGEVVAPMKHTEEARILWYSVAIVDGFYNGLNGIGHDWKGSVAIAQKDAEALWRGCKFEVLR